MINNQRMKSHPDDYDRNTKCLLNMIKNVQLYSDLKGKIVKNLVSIANHNTRPYGGTIIALIT